MKNRQVEIIQFYGDMKLLDFLKEKPTERFTKYEAYCYMLNKACVQYIPDNFPCEGIPPLKESQFIISKTELAEVWHWHRATVRSFLDKLSEYGQLARQDFPKGILCTMLGLKTEKNDNASQASTSELLAKQIMYSWASGKSSLKLTAIICEYIINNASAYQSGNLPNSSESDCRIIRKQTIGTLIRYAVISSLHGVNAKSVPVELINDLYLLFVEIMKQDWEHMLLFIDELPKWVSEENINPICLDAEEASELLDKIYSNYSLFLQDTRLDNPADRISNRVQYNQE